MKKYCLYILLFLFCSGVTVAQQYTIPPNKPHYDVKKWHFGFTLGPDVQHMRIANNSNVISPELLTAVDHDNNGDTYCYSEKISITTGFHVGIITSLRLGRYWNLRMIPSLSLGQNKEITSQLFNDNSLVLDPDTVASISTHSVNSTYVACPILLKYKSVRINNARPYLIGGVSFKYDLATKQEEAITLNKADISLEFGIGSDFYLEQFRLGVEVRFGFGLLNVLDDTYYANNAKMDNYYITSSIDHIKARTLTISLNFE